MIGLLDTNVVLWILAGDESRVPGALRDHLETIERVAVSAASVWEIEIKRAKGKLRAPDDILAAIHDASLDLIAITPVHARDAGRLPPIHDDPFDRMLVAQGIAEGLTIFTSDAVFGEYGVLTERV